ncbi:MAG: NAD(P)H-binding protein [Rhodoferax sp.]|nr:NAD(P)H-binding protein [Rhodoferax sp.]
MVADYGRVAMVAGATGLVGQEILAALLADKTYSVVHCVGRRMLDLRHPKLSQILVDFAALPTLPQANDVFIALGTTMKVAGSQAVFKAVDLDAVLALALAARAQGATRLGVVSAMGANADSPIFYNRVKGEMEEALKRLDFESLVIARPSMLFGQRESLRQAARPGERAGLFLMRSLRPLIPANYRAIAAKDVANALIRGVKNSEPGIRILLSGAMQAK